jgi:hypothetical protein
VKKFLISAFLLVGACHDQRPPAPTPKQADQLNDAENMLNGMAANEEGPADRGTHQSNTLMGPSSTGPSNSSD